MKLLLEVDDNKLSPSEKKAAIDQIKQQGDEAKETPTLNTEVQDWIAKKEAEEANSDVQNTPDEAKSEKEENKLSKREIKKKQKQDAAQKKKEAEELKTNEELKASVNKLRSYKKSEYLELPFEEKVQLLTDYLKLNNTDLKSPDLWAIVVANQLVHYTDSEILNIAENLPKVEKEIESLILSIAVQNNAYSETLHKDWIQKYLVKDADQPLSDRLFKIKGIVYGLANGAKYVFFQDGSEFLKLNAFKKKLLSLMNAVKGHTISDELNYRKLIDLTFESGDVEADKLGLLMFLKKLFNKYLPPQQMNTFKNFDKGVSEFGDKKSDVYWSANTSSSSLMDYLMTRNIKAIHDIVLSYLDKSYKTIFKRKTRVDDEEFQNRIAADLFDLLTSKIPDLAGIKQKEAMIDGKSNNRK